MGTRNCGKVGGGFESIVLRDHPEYDRPRVEGELRGWFGLFDRFHVGSERWFLGAKNGGVLVWGVEGATARCGWLMTDFIRIPRPRRTYFRLCRPASQGTGQSGTQGALRENCCSDPLSRTHVQILVHNNRSVPEDTQEFCGILFKFGVEAHLVCYNRHGPFPSLDSCARVC